MRVNRSFAVEEHGVGLLYGQFVVNRRVRWIHTPTFLATLAVAGLVWSVLPARPAAAAAPVKTMSFNVRFDNGTQSAAANAWVSTTGTSRRDLATSVINDFDPDILGVQEALNNQINDLQNGLPGYDFYGVGRDNGATAGEYSGIFYRSNRFTRTNQGTFWLSNTPDVPSFFPGTCCRRIASWAILEDNQASNREYFVLNTHWDHQVQAARVLSAQLIRNRINLLSGGRPLIVMGDLNSTETNVAYLDLIGANDPNGFQLLDSYREVVPVKDPQEATFNGFSGITFGSRVDYVLHDGSFSAADASIVQTNFSGSYPSDHYPVTALLQPIPEPGDFDGDGDVDGTDFLNWQRGLSPNPFSASDLADWEANYDIVAPHSATSTAVPEPSACIVLLSGMLAMLFPPLR